MEIYVLNRDFDIIGAFSVYESILWTSKFHEPGKFKAQYIFTEQINKIMERGNIIYKTDEDEPMFITRKFLKLNKYGEQTITIEGYTLSRYLNRRIIWGKMVMSGKPEALMREMVDKQCIHPDDDNRIIPRLELGDLKGYEAENIEKQISYDNLQEALTAISTVAELGYRIRLDYDRKKMIFETYRGVDRTVGTDQPCIFTRDYKNILTQTYSEDETNYRNVCLIGGPGEDTDRIMADIGTEAAGLDRYELFYNAAGISDKDISRQELIAQLETKGKEKMAAYYVAKAFESKINKQKAMPFALGDYVTCTDTAWNVAVNTQVKVTEKGFSKTEESFVATFGDDAPTLINLIKAKE